MRFLNWRMLLRVHRLVLYNIYPTTSNFANFNNNFFTPAVSK